MLKELVPVRGTDTSVNDAFLALREQMDRVFDEWFNSDFEVVGRASRDVSFFAPRADLVEGEKEIRFCLELPGMDRKDVQLELFPHRLVISGKKDMTFEKEREKYLHRERFFGTFRRELALPCPIDEKGVRAEFDHGVLTVFLPKAMKQEVSAKKIEVHPARQRS
jgi:HSP20 family protein